MSYPVYTLVLKPRFIFEKEQRQIALDHKMALEMSRAQEFIEISDDEEEVVKEDPNQIRMTAERIRCAEINKVTSSGRVIVGDPYYFADNKHWSDLARMELYGTEYQNEGISHPREDFRTVVTAESRDFVSEYLEGLETGNSRQIKMHRQHLKAQQRVNRMQDYSRFGSQKRKTVNRKK